MEWACRMEFWRRFTMGTRRRSSRCTAERSDELEAAKIERGDDSHDSSVDSGGFWRVQDPGKESGASVVRGGGDAGGRDSFEDRTGRVCAFRRGQPVWTAQEWGGVADVR